MISNRLEVWGDPIGHSQSPVLHMAAYRELGLDWLFTRREVPEARFADALASARLRGIAVTYPLKERAFAAAERRDPRAELTGVANTLLFTDAGLRAYNTDVGGIARALAEIGFSGAPTVRIVGSGATSTSALVALGELGAGHVEVAARRIEQAVLLAELGEKIGVRTTATSLAETRGSVDLTIATLPGGADVDPFVADRLSESGGTLFDVAYGDWPTALAERWAGQAHHGLGMLLHQAVLQVRIFTSGSPDQPLDGEQGVIEAMRAAVPPLG